ncbi:S53 family peptidase [Ferrimicrobium sp.]|uniref:S53 family peptidase n=1 Tax=Ferrimicrobium sp. TaxID=2926050 RepID=UPI002625A6C5|nr:S53 family peptidase [Ferrimicrobium sp.]
MLRKLGFVSSSLALASLTALALPGSVAVAASVSGPTPMIEVGPVIKSTSTVPPTSTFCKTYYQIACYGPAQMAAEYNYGPAYAAGANGKGQTIVIFDSYGSPTIRADLAHFDKAYGLPAPPAFNIYHPEGNVVLNYNNLPSPANNHSKQLQTEVGWAYETTLDVEYAHAMAPGATIDLVTVPVNETQGVQGLQNLEKAQAWALANLHANIWSNSWSTTEQAFHNAPVIQQLNKLYAKAAASGVSVFFAAGDSGVANTNKQGVTYPYPTVNFPTSSPNVIAVGGTQIGSEPATITSHVTEQVWNDGYGAGGGGFSSIFPEPAYQSSAGISDPTGMRGLPDVSYNAAVISAVLIYESFDPVYGPGWVPIGGTSAATPQWAAVDADVQSALGSQGFLAPKLYQIYQNPSLYAKAFYPVLSGNNSFDGITGYSAGPGWNAASGLGTPNVSGLIGALKTLS